MKLEALVGALGCKVIHRGGNFDSKEIRHVVASDLMSDVLVVDKEHLLLVTSLPSDQTIRTSDIVGAHAVLVVNNKNLSASMVTLAREMDVTLMQSSLSKFDACVMIGKLMNPT
jgi:hypothetical protein